MDAKKAKFTFSFCENCECYTNLEDKYKKYNKYKNCPITKKLKEITKGDTLKLKEVASFFKVTEKQVYRYTDGTANIYKKLGELNYFTILNFNLFLGCTPEEIECPHMRKPKLNLGNSFSSPDLTNFYSYLFNTNIIKESTSNFIQAVYNNAKPYHDYNTLNVQNVKDIIENDIKELRKKCMQDYELFLNNYEESIIESYCNIKK